MAVDKLVDSAQLDADLSAVANAIRAKGGTSASLAFPNGFVDAIGAIETGGGGTEEAPLNDVNFIDYDGTILYSYSASEFAALESLPANPTHAGLTAQGWNWTLAQAQAKVAECGKCIIGQMYITNDGKSRIYCSFDELFLSPYLGIAPNGTVVVDWGDNSATDTLTGTSLTTAKYVQHTYATPGDYCITLEVTSGSFAFIGSSQGSYLLTVAANNTDRRFSASYVKKIHIGANASLGANCFEFCSHCEEITIPYGITSLGNYSLHYFYALKSLTIPSSVTSIGTQALASMGALRNISFPPTITSYTATNFTYTVNLRAIVFPDSAVVTAVNMLQGDYALRFVVWPANETTISGNAFRFCPSLESFTVPSGVTSIATYAFNDCWTLRELHFKPTSPPTVGGSNAWTNIPTTCKIYVPTGSLSAYTSATNYPSSSTYTYVEE